MFQERPYRQQRQSIWSIWWFVGLMSLGLAGWHLEILPFGQSGVTTSAPAGSPLDADELLPHAFLDEPHTTARLKSDLTAADSPFLPPPQQKLSAAPDSIAQVGFEQVRYEPGLHSEPNALPEIPAHQLIYKADENPVEIRPIPNAIGSTPYQPAGYLTPPASNGQPTPLQTASASRPINAAHTSSHERGEFQTALHETRTPGETVSDLRPAGSLEPPQNGSLPSPADGQSTAAPASAMPAASMSDWTISPEAEADIVRLR